MYIFSDPEPALLLSPNTDTAKSNVVLSFDEVKALALIGNASLITGSNNLLISKNNYIDAVRKYYIPSLRAGIKTPANAVMNSAEEPSASLTGSLVLSEELPWGTAVYVKAEETITAESPVSESSSADSMRTKAILGISQPLFVTYAGAYERDTLERTAAEALIDFAERERTVLSGVENAYYDYISTVKAIALNSRRIATSESNYLLSRQKYEAGLIREIDFLRVQINFFQAQSSRLDLERTRNMRRAAVFTIIGFDHGTNAEISCEFMFTPRRFDIPLSVARTLSNDSILKKIEITRIQEKAAYRKSLEKYLPQGTITAELAADLSGSDAHSLQGTVTLNTDFFHKGAARRNNENHRLRMQNINIQKEQRLREIASELTLRITAIDALLAETEILEENLVRQERALEIDNQRFSLGLISSEVMLTTEEALDAAQLSLLRKKVEYAKAVTGLEYSFYPVRIHK